jgi:hypothetical protein
MLEMTVSLDSRGCGRGLIESIINLGHVLLQCVNHHPGS